MMNATVRVQLALTVAFCVSASVPPRALHAQLVRGTVKSSVVGASLDRAQVIAQNEEGKEIAKTTTDASGRFRLPVKAIGKSFVLTVRRLGIKQTTSNPLTLQPSDTVDIELLVEETETGSLDTVEVKAAMMRNERSLREAERRSWKVIRPAIIEQHRDRANSLRQLLQSTATNGITFPRSDYECFRNTRNNQCLVLVIDGRVMGPTAAILPSDIYFIAIVPQNDAIVQYGSSYAPFGAIAIYTRQNGDKYR